MKSLLKKKIPRIPWPLKGTYFLSCSASCHWLLSRFSICSWFIFNSPSSLSFSLSHFILAFLSRSRAPSNWKKRKRKTVYPKKSQSLYLIEGIDIKYFLEKEKSENIW